jgi:uncharacterized repeat protein (TIGR02543 family)
MMCFSILLSANIFKITLVKGYVTWDIQNPTGIAVDGSGNVYVIDYSNSHVEKFSSFGVYLGQVDSGQLSHPFGIAVDGYGNVYVVDSNNNRVVKFLTDSTVQTWGVYGTGNGEFRYPSGIAVDGYGNVYVADTSNNRVEKFASDGTYVSQFGSQGTAGGEFNGPYGIAVDSSGNVYVTDKGNDRVEKFDSSFVFKCQWGNYGYGDGQFIQPLGIAVDSSGYVYVADSLNDRIQKFYSPPPGINYVFHAKWGSSGTGDYQFNVAHEVCVDSSGAVYVADFGNSRVQKFNQYTLTISKNDPSGENNYNYVLPYEGQDTIVEGSTVAITAVATHGYSFIGWTGALSGTTNPAAITIDGDKTVTANFAPPVPGITIHNAVLSGSVPDNWNYQITDSTGAVVDTFALAAGGGDTHTFASSGDDTFTITATPKYGYDTAISAQTDTYSWTEFDEILPNVVTVVLAAGGWATVTFTNAEQPSFAVAPVGSPPPGGMTYTPPPQKVVPVQAAWNPDKNNDGKIDLVAGKPTTVLFNPTGIQSGVSLHLAFTGANPLPSPVDKAVSAADLAANAMSFPIVLDNDATTANRDVTISISYAGTGTLIDQATVTVRKTNALSLYYGYMHKSGGQGYSDPKGSTYVQTVQQSNTFITSVYPVKAVSANTPSSALPSSQQIGGSNSMASDCVAVAAYALNNKAAIGVAVTSTGYFAKFSQPSNVGVSYGPNCKGVIVAENYWTAAAHEVGHTFNLYVKPTPEEYQSYPLYGLMTSGVSAATGQWRAGQDFMGAAPYMSLDNTWVDSAGTYKPLFNALTQTLGDPEIVVVSGIFHSDTSQLELPLVWSRLEGTPSQIVPGNYALKYIDASGSPIGNPTPFDVQFGFSASVGVTVGKNRPADEGGLTVTDEAPFCFAVALPAGTAAIQILDKTDPNNPAGVVKGTVYASQILDASLTHAYFTDSDYNPIDSFACVFTPDKGTSYKMSATNPGTFCYNLKIANNDPTSIFTATVQIPYHFVLKSTGSSSVEINGQPVPYTFTPGTSVTVPGTLTVPNILINQGQTKTLTVRLDYGLKFQYGIPPPQPFTSSSQTTFAQGYAFRATISSYLQGENPSTAKTFQADTGTVAAFGKKVTAIGGFLTDVNGAPKGGLTVQIFSGSTQIGTSLVSNDGFYFVVLSQAGTYTVKVCNSPNSQVAISNNVKISKDQFVETDFNNLNPADPAITGFVTDAGGNGVAGVKVQLLDKQGRGLATITTNLGGYYVFRFSQPGQYTVKITVPKGYTSTVTSTTLSVKQFETAKVNFSLAGEK